MISHPYGHMDFVVPTVLFLLIFVILEMHDVSNTLALIYE